VRRLRLPVSCRPVDDLSLSFPAACLALCAGFRRRKAESFSIQVAECEGLNPQHPAGLFPGPSFAPLGAAGTRPFQESASFMTKIYVGNLPFSASENEVRDLFSQHGTVESVSLITDRETGRPRGFGFVEMSRADATRAIQSLNGKDMGGRPLRVNEAQERGAGGGGGGPRGGGGGPKRW
jgi:RNA recognition motif-containing protein